MKNQLELPRHSDPYCLWDNTDINEMQEQEAEAMLAHFINDEDLENGYA